MNKRIFPALSFLLFFLLRGTLGFSQLPGEEQQPEKVSTLGKYSGYSQPLYKEWSRTSQYVAVRDGTKLAVDIIRPIFNGKPVSDPLPVIWTQNRYHRASYSRGGKIITILDQIFWMKTILEHGYVIASVDDRGSGASFGWLKGTFIPDEAQDAYDITEWFACQPWCNGCVGMFGISYLGITQYMAASTAPPHLRAIIPDMAMFDLYSFSYPGGVLQGKFLSEWFKAVRQLDTVIPLPPVDEDPESKLLAQALKEHQKNDYSGGDSSGAPFRNSWDERAQVQPYIDWSPHTYLKGIEENGSQIAIYHVAGWFDMWPRDALAWFSNLKNPQKIIIGPWSHSHEFAGGWKDTVSPLLGHDFSFDIGAEELRFYDYWLKGIDNGVMNEPPISYYVMGAAEGDAWRRSHQWPLPEAEPKKFYFSGGPSGSVRSVNDGLLSADPPKEDQGRDEYTVDYTTTTGQSTRWANGRGGDFRYPDMASHDEKALTYTTRALESDIRITGHPVVRIWVTSTVKDGDFFGYLEEVDEKGASHYITEGVLRASHRKLFPAPHLYMGLPYHRSFEEDVQELPEGTPVELVFDLHPTSNIFDSGHRIRFSVTCADRDNFQTPELSSAPKVTVYRSRDFASSIELPVVKHQAQAEARPQTRSGILLVVTMIVGAVLVAVIVYFFFLKNRIRK